MNSRNYFNEIFQNSNSRKFRPAKFLRYTLLQTAGSTRSYTGLSRPPETRIPFGQDRLREVGHIVDGGVSKHSPGLSVQCAVATRLRSTANSLAVLCCHSTTESLRHCSVGVSTKSYLRIMLLAYVYGWGAYTRDKSTCART